MKKLIYLVALSLLLATSFHGYSTYAQASGSVETSQGLGIASGGTYSSLSESLYIGPGNYQIDGIWDIYSKNIWISPDAVITGSGLMKFFNPSAAGGTASISFLDGNNSAYIDVNLELQNQSGMQLRDQTSLPADMQSAGWANTIGISTLKIGKDFNLALDGANVVLDNTATGDFSFDSDATVSNYRPARMVVTNNSIQSHMVKDGAINGFVFPVGITVGDYTPVKLTGSSIYHVSVQDYTTSTPNEGNLTKGGVSRTWHIYSDVAATTSIDLEHNKATETSYVDNSAYITQYDGSVWDAATCSAGTGSGTLTTGGSISTASELSRSLSVDNTNAYYTKTSCVMPVSDLTPIIYARPSSVYKTTPITLVVDVVELLGVPTSGTVVVRLTKDSKVSLNFDPLATSIDNRSVQNSLWTLDASSNASYYILTTTQPVPAGDKLSFGFSGVLTPGATTGTLTLSSVIMGGSGGEVRIDNNTDADKIDYFQQ